MAYLPFGDGAHQCVGQAFFTMESVLVLATVLSRYDVQVHGNPRPRLGRGPGRRATASASH